MTANLIPFEFESQPVRIIERGNEPWFVLADVCRVLEIGNPSDAASRLDEDEKMTLDNTEGHSGQRGGAQSFTIINESGLYSLILTSRKPSAKRFKKWVTAEVLPSIRKTGAYGAPAVDPMAVLNDPSAMRGLLLTYSEKVLELQAAVESQREDVEALDRIAKADGSLCITDAAKALQMRPKDLFDYLKAHGWIYRRTGSDHWVGYQTRVNGGDLEHKVTTVLRADGSEKTTEQVRITSQGLTKLAKLVSRAASAA